MDTLNPGQEAPSFLDRAIELGGEAIHFLFATPDAYRAMSNHCHDGEQQVQQDPSALADAA